MEHFSSVERMQAWSRAQRAAGKRIAFVPTMGALHEGHLSLLRAGRCRADRLVLSIYVNPTQFGPGEDLSRYPRDLDGDLGKVRPCGVDAVFFPDDAAMYPQGAQTFVTVEEISRPLCGERRPGHFRGVATVVAKLFNIVVPNVALFGEKDYQQLAVIRRMVRDLNFSIEIIGCPIVREPDGLAMSSRNAFLSAAQRQEALVLSRSLALAEKLVVGGECVAGVILDRVCSMITSSSAVRLDYAEIRDAQTLQLVKRLERPAVLALAAFVGATRLIDNRVLCGE